MRERRSVCVREREINSVCVKPQKQDREGEREIERKGEREGE